MTRMASEEARRKMSLAKKGKPLSAAHRQRLSEAHRGLARSREHCENLSRSLRGHVVSPETRDKLRRRALGRRLSVETRAAMSRVRRGRRPHHADMRGERNGRWRGGITPIARLVRASRRYRTWRRRCLARDGFSCRRCGARGGALHAHHRKAFKRLLDEARRQSPQLAPRDAVLAYAPMWDVENGVTLCERCHIGGGHLN